MEHAGAVNCPQVAHCGELHSVVMLNRSMWRPLIVLVLLTLSVCVEAATLKGIVRMNEVSGPQNLMRMSKTYVVQ
jgi:hypothetical protein